jgi:hypothetical protein
MIDYRLPFVALLANMFESEVRHSRGESNVVGSEARRIGSCY